VNFSKHSKLVSRFLLTWNYRLTGGGKVFLAGVFLTGLTGFITLGIPVYHLFLVLTLFYTVAILWSGFFRPKVKIAGILPSRCTARRIIEGDFTVINERSIPAYDLCLGFYGLPQSFEDMNSEPGIEYLPARERGKITVRLLPLRRGHYDLPPLRAYSIYPFNFRRAGTSQLEIGSILVLPDYHPLEHFDIPSGRRYQQGGILLSSNVGESPEYMGNREYMPGDSVRRIDFKSWARLAKPAVKEYQEEYYCRVALVLDTYIHTHRRRPKEGFPNLEGAISLTAAIAEHLSSGDYITDIFAAGPDLFVFRSGRSISHFDNILEILACIEECRTNPFDVILPAFVEAISGISAVVYVFLDWDDSREKFLRAAVETGCQTKVILVCDGHPSKNPDKAIEWAGEFLFFTPEQIQKGNLYIQ